MWDKCTKTMLYLCFCMFFVLLFYWPDISPIFYERFIQDIQREMYSYKHIKKQINREKKHNSGKIWNIPPGGHHPFFFKKKGGERKKTKEMLLDIKILFRILSSFKILILNIFILRFIYQVIWKDFPCWSINEVAPGIFSNLSKSIKLVKTWDQVKPIKQIKLQKWNPTQVLSQ